MNTLDPKSNRARRTMPGVLALLFSFAGALAGVPSLKAQALPAAVDWAALGQTVANDLAAGRFEPVEARYDAKMKGALPSGKLAAIWSGLQQQTGPFREIAGVKVQELSGFHIVVLTCKFERTPLDIKLTFDAEQHLSGLFFLPVQAQVDWSPPLYAQPTAFQERPVTVGRDPWALPGALTLPTGKGPFPALVLVHGSGPHDADEAIGPNRPFKDLAWGLASQGIAVLRYTKRTAAHAAQLDLTGGKFTVQDETVDDARLAVALAAQQPEIDKSRIFVLGHSLGGMLAPRIAQGDGQVAGLVILAGSARPLEKVVLDQLRYLLEVSRAQKADAATLKLQQEALHEAEESARQIESPQLAKDTPVKFLGATIPGSYFLDLRSYDPPSVAAKLPIPILLLQAEKDYQVTGADLAAWKKKLAGRPNVTFKSYPGLFHLFSQSQAAGTALGTPADYDQAGHVNEGVVKDIANWVKALSQEGKLK